MHKLHNLLHEILHFTKVIKSPLNRILPLLATCSFSEPEECFWKNCNLHLPD